jgi:hypothetical protein
MVYVRPSTLRRHIRPTTNDLLKPSLKNSASTAVPAQRDVSVIVRLYVLALFVNRRDFL